jgi:hypothetical protein
VDFPVFPFRMRGMTRQEAHSRVVLAMGAG